MPQVPLWIIYHVIMTSLLLLNFIYVLERILILSLRTFALWLLYGNLREKSTWRHNYVKSHHLVRVNQVKKYISSHLSAEFRGLYVLHKWHEMFYVIFGGSVGVFLTREWPLIGVLVEFLLIYFSSLVFSFPCIHITGPFPELYEVL